VVNGLKQQQQSNTKSVTSPEKPVTDFFLHETLTSVKEED
jgi:hypothetical protein